jgi:hypothetical protein
MNANQRTTTNAASSAALRSAQVERVVACCGGPAPAGTSACCAEDADVKSDGGSGCGCSTPTSVIPRKQTSCCG